MITQITKEITQIPAGGGFAMSYRKSGLEAEKSVSILRAILRRDA
jgi:hypothetical protein